GVDAVVGGLELLVHLDAAGVVDDAGPLQAQAFDVGLASVGDQQMASLDHLGLALLADMHGDALYGALDALHPRAGMQQHALLGEAIDDDAARFRVLVAEDGGGIDDGDVGAEHAMGLGELHAHGATAEHDQMLDPLAHVEDRLVGEMRHLVETWDRRDDGRGTVCPYEAAGADQVMPGLHGVLVKEACLLLEDADAEPGVALDGIVRCDGGDHAIDVVMHPGVVDLRLDDVDAEGSSGAHGLGTLAGGEQRLRRHAAVIEAVAAHAALLDEHDRDAELSRRGSHREASRPCADHAEVRLQHLFHVSPSSPWLTPYAGFRLKRLTAMGISATSPSATKPATSPGVSKARGSSTNGHNSSASDPILARQDWCAAC